MKIKITNEAALIEICKTISWMDRMSQNAECNYNDGNLFREGLELTNCEKILTHWICYITNRQMPFEIVWDKGVRVFSELVSEYSRRNKLTPENILKKYYESYKNKNKKERFRFKSTGGVTFASRYITQDYKNILQTLEVLNHEKYKRNIIAYIVDIIRRFKDKEDLLLRVACGLHLLTYQLDGGNANSEQIINIINNNEEFERRLSTFKKTSTHDKKRLWCCIRDYKKGLYHQIFIEAIKEVAKNEGDANELISTWKDLPMNQLELPGDIWNNNPVFRDNLFADVIDINSIPKTWKMPDIVRDLYEQLKEKEELKDFYPEQFDVTFDFVPRMCDKKLCNVCPFGNGIEKTCIPTKNKYCPVLLFSCGYIVKCSENDCILKKDSSKGICRGVK